MTCWFIEVHATVILLVQYFAWDQYSRERTILRSICEIYLYHWIVFGCLQIDFFYAWYDDRCDWTVQFNTSLNDINRQSRWQACKKAKTCAVSYSTVKWCEVAKTWGMLDWLVSPPHVEDLSCFMQLYNRMTSQVLAFPWRWDLEWTSRSFRESKCQV